MTLAVRYATRSDIGRHRKTNEDSWLAAPPLFAVADGMGGAQAGEVASRIAVETLAQAVPLLDPNDREATGKALLEAAERANERIWALGSQHASQAGMGTTLTAVALCTDGARLAHVGDSRAYLLRGGLLTQLTEDHSLVAEMVRGGELAPEQASGHPLRSVLSRALGTEAEGAVDALDVDLQPEDVLLLCSDGLTGPVPEERIAELLAQPDPEQAAAALVSDALERGGPDNITVVVLRLQEHIPAAEPPQEDEAAAGVVVPLEQEAAGSAQPGATPAAAATTADGTELPSTGAGANAAASSSIATAAQPVAASSSSATVAQPAARKRRWVGVTTAVALLLVVLVGGALAADQLHWLGVDDVGIVTVYRGVPWEFAGLRLFRTAQTPAQLRYDQLSSAGQQRVDERDIVWGQAAAERLFKELQGSP